MHSYRILEGPRGTIRRLGVRSVPGTGVHPPTHAVTLTHGRTLTHGGRRRLYGNGETVISVHVHDGAAGPARAFQPSRDVYLLATPAAIIGAAHSDIDVKLGVWPRVADSSIEYMDPTRACARVQAGAEIILEGRGPAFVAMVAAQEAEASGSLRVGDPVAPGPHPSAPDDWTIHGAVPDGGLLAFALARPRVPGRARARFLFHRVSPGKATMIVCLTGKARVESSDAPEWAHELGRDQGITMPHQIRPCVADAEAGTILMIAVVDQR